MFWAMKRLLVLLSLIQFSCVSQRVEHIQLAGRDVAVWLPKDAAAPEAGDPLIVFSHGFGGCNTQSTFLMEALAKGGYVVLAPNHQDARCGSGWRRERLRPEESLVKAGHWSDQTYRDRAADVEAVLDAALREGALRNVRIDARRVGLAGHSLGGYTALGLAGGWPSWKDPRVQAVLALSPFCSPYLEKGDLARMNVPVMYQGGTLDLGITPFVRRPLGAFEQSSDPKYYVEFKGAGHFAWTNLNPRFQVVIEEYSVAFFDRYLKTQDGGGRLARLIEKPYPGQVSDVKDSLRGKVAVSSLAK